MHEAVTVNGAEINGKIRDLCGNLLLLILLIRDNQFVFFKEGEMRP